ncbi:MAG: glycosyltransferase [Actinomycetales bacterium]
MHLTPADQPSAARRRPLGATVLARFRAYLQRLARSARRRLGSFDRAGQIDKDSSSRPTVLVYAPFSFNGRGPAESCAAILSAFDRQEARTVLYGCRFRRPMPEGVELRPSVATWGRYLPWRFVARRALRRLDADFARALRSCDPATTIAYFWPDPPPDLVTAANVRGVLTVREMINTACATAGPILDAAYAQAGLPPDHPVTPQKISQEVDELGRHDYFFASNPEVERSLQALGIDRSHILRTTFGWSAQRLGPATAQRRSERTRFICLGSLGVRKGVPVLLQAWRQAGLDADLLLVGHLDEAIADLLAEHHDPTVEVRDFTSDVGALLRSCDVFVFPTFEEGGPQVTYEAAGCGLAIITTPMGAARLVDTGNTGIVVEAGSVSELTAAIRLLHENPDLRARYGRNAETAAASYEYRVVGRQRQRQLVGLLAGGP